MADPIGAGASASDERLAGISDQTVGTEHSPLSQPSHGPGSSDDSKWNALNVGVQLLQAAVAVALFVVGGVVLVRTLIDFLDSPGNYPASIVSALDGILVVVIVVDILHTVLTHLRSATFPVRPFLIIGMLAGVRDILSASARLTLTGREGNTSFSQSIIELGIGVGVVVALLVGLLLLRAAAEPGSNDIQV